MLVSAGCTHLHSRLCSEAPFPAALTELIFKVMSACDFGPVSLISGVEHFFIDLFALCISSF